ncbi:hypothetical protein HPB48_021232 [Haemaphysalis longicornis]|uniref:Uncharacterized protein n=1 Tax=Haemaphysalis longicornis TaxID=44386 RepID=A0A9J6G8U0_HAELO|nr:hypothetical protein HPB48_021232 [Haemaphysalis longicornis]
MALSSSTKKKVTQRTPRPDRTATGTAKGCTASSNTWPTKTVSASPSTPTNLEPCQDPVPTPCSMPILSLPQARVNQAITPLRGDKRGTADTVRVGHGLDKPLFVFRKIHLDDDDAPVHLAPREVARERRETIFKQPNKQTYKTNSPPHIVT